ncbi:hypothetical protein F4779DRAFT_595335 [Xylariaceae sp. FL0662B]|nr:hypothetical protein F4779DRAFT_595335 [Xylariaceae sp. FL0662B]
MPGLDHPLPQSSSPRPRSPSAVSERTLIDVSTPENPSLSMITKTGREADSDEATLCGKTFASQRQGLSLPQRVNGALKRVKSKLAGTDPKPPNLGSYQDTVFYWRALAETKM